MWLGRVTGHLLPSEYLDLNLQSPIRLDDMAFN
jgi:hypothetical protein